MFDHQVTAYVVGRGRAPYAEQLLAGVHNAYVAVDDHAEREQPEQHADRYRRQLEPIERLHGRVLVNERAVVEVQPVLDQHVLWTGRLGCRRRHQLLRGNGRRILLLEHANLQVCVVHVVGDLVQLPCGPNDGRHRCGGCKGYAIAVRATR